MKTKIVRTASAMVLAGGLLVSLAACTTDNNSDAPTSAVSGSAGTLGNKTSAPTVSPEEEAAAVSDTYEGFLNALFTIDGTEASAVFKDLENVSTSSSDADKQKTIDELYALSPEAFGSFDTEGLSLDEKGAIYSGFAYIGAYAATSAAEYSFELPDSAVTVTDNTATVDPLQLVVTVDGQPTDTGATAQADLTSFVKKDGKWLIVVPDEALQEAGVQ